MATTQIHWVAYYKNPLVHFAIKPASGDPPTRDDLVYSPVEGRLSRPVWRRAARRRLFGTAGTLQTYDRSPLRFWLRHKRLVIPSGTPFNVSSTDSEDSSGEDVVRFRRLNSSAPTDARGS